MLALATIGHLLPVKTVASMHGLSASTMAMCTAAMARTTVFVALETDSDLLMNSE